MTEPGPLSPEQKEQLAVAAALRDKLLRPARIARVNAWTIGIFGALTVLLGLATGGGGAVVGLALLAVAWNEMRGIRRLTALDPEGGRILGWNQLILAGVIAAYCTFAIVRARVSPDPSMTQLEELGAISSGLVASVTAVVYGAIALLVAIVQVLFARYHIRAGERIAAFRRETPAWVVELLGGLGPAGGK